MHPVSEALYLVPASASATCGVDQKSQVQQRRPPAAAKPSDAGRSGCVQPIGMILPAVLQRYQLLPHSGTTLRVVTNA